MNMIYINDPIFKVIILFNEYSLKLVKILV